MYFTNWYVIFILGFAAGFAVCKLWDEAWAILKNLYCSLRKKNGNNGGLA